MGGLLSRWKKKQTTIEVLEGLEKKIKSLESTRQGNLARQKRVIGSLVLFSVLAYVLAVFVFYFFYLPDAWSDRVMYSSPLLGFALVVWLLKRFLHWYFVKRITKNDSALQELKGKKEKILDEVMETETYKKAKEILEKYDPDRHKAVQAASTATPVMKPTEGQELRQRTGPQFQQTPLATPMVRRVEGGARGAAGGPSVPMVTPNLPRTGPGQVMTGPMGHPNGRRQGTPMLTNPPPMPRPVLPRERGVMDRLVELLVGDGPQNRYALICKNCQSHNGMALKEEFEYMGFRCCYCFTVNSARKQKDYAPRLDGSPAVPHRAPTQSDINTAAASDSEPEEKANSDSRRSSSYEEAASDTKDAVDKKSD